MIDEEDSRQPDLEVIPARSDQATADAMDELKALTDVMQALRSIRNDAARERILRAAASFFKVQLVSPIESQAQPSQSHIRAVHHEPPPFSVARTVTPKEFLLEKQPRTDVERVACIAYFLTHYRETPFFKTLDISKLNTEAAQPKFSNAAKSVDNATTARYLVPAVKGNKQISATGELFVQALPDRDSAKNVMASQRPKRRRRPIGSKVGTEESSESE